MQNALRNAAVATALTACVAATAAAAATAAEQATPPVAGAKSAQLDDEPRQATAEKPAPAEPAAQRIVAEDDNVRIEEVKVRGQTQSITVKSKLRGVKPYEIVPGSGARDPSQPGSPAGQRVWHFLSF